MRENLQRDQRKRVHCIETNKITALFSLEIVQPDNNEMAHLKHWKENIIDLESYIQKQICFEMGGKIYSQIKSEKINE